MKEIKDWKKYEDWDISKGASYATVMQMTNNLLLIELLGDNPSDCGEVVKSMESDPSSSMRKSALESARKAIALRIGNQIIINLAGVDDWNYGSAKNEEVK